MVLKSSSITIYGEYCGLGKLHPLDPSDLIIIGGNNKVINCLHLNVTEVKFIC